LLVDEVLAVGDIRFQKKCLGKMGDVARSGRTVIFVSHQLNQIRRLCNRAVWIDAGTVSQVGSTPEVVGAYEAAMSSNDRQTEPGRSGAKQTAQFLSWKIVGGEEESDSLHRLDSVGQTTVSFLLQVNSSIQHGQHGIALFDLDRRLMWAYSTDGLSFDPGIHQLAYTFPFLPLCPKSYNWQVSLWDDTGNVDLWEALPEMLVVAPNYQHAKDEWNGVLNLPCTLDIKRKG